MINCASCLLLPIRINFLLGFNLLLHSKILFKLTCLEDFIFDFSVLKYLYYCYLKNSDKISEHPRHENFVKFHPPKVNNVPIPSQSKKKRVTKKQLEDLKITQNIKKFFSDHSAITGKINTPDLHFEQQSNSIPNSATHVDRPENVPGAIRRT